MLVTLLFLCAFISVAVGSPATAMSVMSDEQVATIAVGWIKGDWQEKNCAEPCCKCVRGGCEYAECTFITVKDCIADQQSPKTCYERDKSMICCRWYKFSDAACSNMQSGLNWYGETTGDMGILVGTRVIASPCTGG